MSRDSMQRGMGQRGHGRYGFSGASGLGRGGFAVGVDGGATAASGGTIAGVSMRAGSGALLADSITGASIGVAGAAFESCCANESAIAPPPAIASAAATHHPRRDFRGGAPMHA